VARSIVSQVLVFVAGADDAQPPKADTTKLATKEHANGLRFKTIGVSRGRSGQTFYQKLPLPGLPDSPSVSVR